MPSHRPVLVTAAASFATLTLLCGAARAQAPAVDADDIGGVVTSPNGPEAGVWVIAETNAFQTRFAQDRRDRRPGPLCRPRSAGGRLSGLGARLRPRGFGQGRGEPGQDREPHGESRAPTPADAAKVYPAIYWYSMHEAAERRAKSRIARRRRTSISRRSRTCRCIGCHQIGQLATRTIPPAFGEFEHRRRPGCGAFSRVRPAPDARDRR